uniref:Uncharacterized protein n=1 Tax=viral metagenome TaxID=1070528 RepID=A0A6M3JFK6_9ZZZZ
MKDRYYIDERVGSIAVRDKTLDDPDSPHLDSCAPGVVKFWQGKYVDEDVCIYCKRSPGKKWIVPAEYIREAEELCESLNGGGHHE